MVGRIDGSAGGLIRPEGVVASAGVPSIGPRDVSLPYAGAARFLPVNFPGGVGSATSVLRILKGPGGTISTQLVGRPLGETWALELYDRGTCDAVRHVVTTLPSIRIGSAGRRTGSLPLTAAPRQAILIALSERKVLVLRLSTTGYRTCRRYFPIPGQS